MAIEIKPAEIVGAKIGDRVSWSTGRHPGAARAYGTIIRVSTNYANHIEVAPEGREGDTRYISPDSLTLAPKKYEVGEEVTLKDEDLLPDGTTLTDVGKLPLFKAHGRWYVIDPETPAPGIRETRLFGTRTITWLPARYTNA